MAFCISSSAVASIALEDDLGRKVELKEPAERIVTLAPFLTELAYSAGAGKKVVGVSAYSDYPPEARALPQVASAMGPEIEVLAVLRPDLVLAWRDSIRSDDVERLERFGIPVFVAQARRLDDVPRLLDAIGRLTGSDGSAAAQGYRRRLAALRAAYSAKERVRVFVEVWHRPLTTIAGRHWINEALEVCAGDNVFRDLDAVAPVVSWEEVYKRDPAVIVATGSAASEREFRANWKGHPTLAAVKSGRLVWVDADRIQRPTARMVEGISQLCERLDRTR